MEKIVAQKFIMENPLLLRQVFLLSLSSDIKSSGTLQHWYQGEHELDPSLSDEEFLTADLPIRVGKFADGLYELETI